jgi:ferrous iron transport protein A
MISLWHREASDNAGLAVSGNGDAIPLTELADRDRALILGVEGAGKARLEAMGLAPGAIVEKLSSTALKGPIVIERGGSRLALGYELARRVIVNPLPPTGS